MILSDNWFVRRRESNTYSHEICIVKMRIFLYTYF